MPRYIYKPLDYSVWMKNYINTLKSGEILVDFGTEFDIMVTENGINIPIPVTRNLREHVQAFLKDNLNSVILKESEINDSLSTTEGLYDKIRKAQTLSENRMETMFSNNLDIKARNVYMNKINQKNVNQLGDIDLQVSSFPIENLRKEMEFNVNLFNSLNSDSTFDGFVKQGSDDLIRIWKEIESMMKYTNEALDTLPSGSADAAFTNYSTSEYTVYDVIYTNYLNNGGSSGTQDPNAFLNGAAGPLVYDETQYYATNPSTSPWMMSHPPLDTWITAGLGLLYPYFPYKKSRNSTASNLSTTRTLDGRRIYAADPRHNIRSAWMHNFDINEGVPLKVSIPSGYTNANTGDYFIMSESNNKAGFFDSDGYLKKTYFKFFATDHGRSNPVNPANGKPYYYSFSDVDIDYDAVVSKTKRSGLQRYPKYAVGGVGEINVNNRRSGIGSGKSEATSARPFYSMGQMASGDIPNTHQFMIRQGVSKTLLRTKITNITAKGMIDPGGNLVGLQTQSTTTDSSTVPSIEP